VGLFAERMLAINEAYRVLSDPQERRQYDAEGYSEGGYSDASSFDSSDVSQAEELMEAGKYAEALGVLRSALRNEPESSELNYMAAVCCYELEHWSNALKYGIPAAKTDPTSAEKALLVGIAYMRLDQSGDAIPWLEKARDLNPYDPDAYGHLAPAYRSSGLHAAAWDCIGRVRRLDPNHPVLEEFEP
jgi:tetratricopeptide (TPR) repeat protein